MFVPVINTASYRNHVTVINKNIIYTDTVLDLKDLGSNICVSSISGIGEYEFESCLQTILENNSNVVFNTVQYSKAEKKIYFYTDRNISISSWEERNRKMLQPIANKQEILEEVKKVLGETEEVPEDCVTLLELFDVIRGMSIKKKALKERYDDVLGRRVKASINDGATIHVDELDPKTKELAVRFSYSNFEYKDIYFVKEDGDLRVSRYESPWYMEVLECCGTLLSQVYDEFDKFTPLENKRIRVVKPVNSRFKVEVDARYGVDVYVLKPGGWSNEFEIEARTYNDYDFDIKCNSNLVMEALRDKMTELYKRIYVPIDDCPESLIELLNELKWEQRKKEEEKNNVPEEESKNVPEGVKKLTLCQRIKKWWNSLE